jgi:magnesium transporter
MIYLTRMLGRPVVDAAGEQVGTISDIAISTGEVFPRVTSLAFLGPGRTPFMLSWRKFVDHVDEDRITLNVRRSDLRFSYLQPDEVLLSRDLLDKQIVDTQGIKVVRVNDLKLSESRGQLRLLGAEVGVRGVLRSLWPPLETAAVAVTRLFRRPLAESIIAWNYMDLLDRDLSHVQLSVTHKRLHELHPADVADVLEQLSPSQRARVFEHLDDDQAADAISELEDELQADVLDDLTEERASDILEIMDPDDAADIIGDLSYEKAETLLHLMGVREARQVRKLLGYKEKSAGGIMTPEVTTVTEDMTVQQVLDQLRASAGELGDIYYIYVVGPKRVLDGVISLRDLIVSSPETLVSEIVERELFTVGPDDDQEQVADMMSKYDLLALPVVDESGRILGIVTVDDALDVMEEESAEDLQLAMGTVQSAADAWLWLRRTGSWAVVWTVIAFALAFAVRALTHGVTSIASDWMLGVAAAVLFLPVVLRFAEDLSARATAGLIEGPGDAGRPNIGRRLWTDALIGLVLGSLAGLAVFAVGDIITGDATLSAALAFPMAVTLLLATLLYTMVAVLAERAVDRGRRVNQTLLSGGLLVLSALVYLGLAGLAWWLATGHTPGLAP